MPSLEETSSPEATKSGAMLNLERAAPLFSVCPACSRHWRHLLRVLCLGLIVVRQSLFLWLAAVLYPARGSGNVSRRVPLPVFVGFGFLLGTYLLWRCQAEAACCF